MNDGWVKLHRQLLDWEWYTDINTSRLFIHLVLTVNHKTNNWRGIEIKRGSRLTSLPKLSAETGLSLSKIRTSIKKLKSTDDIADKTHAQHTVLYVNNYDSYQDDSRQDNSPVAGQSQTNDRPIASNKNDKKEKNDNNDKKKIKEAAPALDFTQLGFTEKQCSDLIRIRARNKGSKLTQNIIKTLAKEFAEAATKGFTYDELLSEWEDRGWKSFRADWIKTTKTTLNGSSGYSKVTQQNLIEAEKWERSFDQ